MFANIKQIFNPKNRDLQKRILFTLFVLFIFKIGTAIIIPGVDRNSLGTDNLGFLGLINAMGGGALERFSIFALGVTPYITASIVVQLLQMEIVPYFSELGKQGQVGRDKLNQITRVLGIVLAFVQGYFLSFAYIKGGTAIEYMEFAVVMTAGTAFLLWLGDKITQKGIGNGVSLLIMAGIIASLPSMFMDAYNGFMTGGADTWIAILSFVVFVLVYILIVVGVVFVETAERRVPITYANKSTTGAQQSYIPIKLNPAGVTPVIFASALISVPSFVAQFSKNVSVTNFVNEWLTYESLTGFIMYALLIVGFSYFYAYYQQFKPKELAENFQKNGGFIPGVRPGEETVKYISKSLSKIVFVGALFLSVLAGLPIVFKLFSNLPQTVTIGGTGLLIVVGVALETWKQVESNLVTRNYSTRKRGRRY